MTIGTASFDLIPSTPLLPRSPPPAYRHSSEPDEIELPRYNAPTRKQQQELVVIVPPKQPCRAGAWACLVILVGGVLFTLAALMIYRPELFGGGQSMNTVQLSTGTNSSATNANNSASARRGEESLLTQPNFSSQPRFANNLRLTHPHDKKMEEITTSPVIDDFTPLSQHQEQTPGTFFAGKPVLHLHAISNITADQHNADLSRLTSPIDVWVTSRHLIVFATTQSLGFKIPYPTITVTAQDGADVLLELNLSDDDTADEEIEWLQMRLTPERIVKHGDEEEQQQASAGANGANGTTSSNDTSTALFKAISDCQELNPDRRGEDDDDEGGEGVFDETAPGATGWITSENMADFMDEDGNFRMPAGMTVLGGEGDEGDGEAAATLGAGAGTTRTAAEANEDGDEDESKWQRTS